MENVDVIILGSGGSGIGAAIYAARFNLKSVVIGDRYGGLIVDTHLVENYPSHVRLSGYELMQKFLEHVKDYPQVNLVDDTAVDVKRTPSGFWVKTLEGKEFAGKTIIFATGTKHREMNVPGENEYKNKGVSYCAICLPPEESIITNSDIKPIGEVTPLTRVLTQDGTYSSISGFTKQQHDGKLISIRPRFFTEPVLLTPNHPVYALKAVKGRGVDYLKDFHFTKPEWIAAEHLTLEDCVLYPILKEMKDIESIQLSDFIEAKKDEKGMIIPFIDTHTSKAIPNQIPVNQELMRLIGYYLAEGTAHKHQLIFSFNKNETEYIGDVQNILRRLFGLDAKVNPHKTNNACQVVVYSKPLADFFKSQFGEYSYKKSLPLWTMMLPQEKQKELVKGMWRGDGCLREKDFCYVTSSRKMAYQLRDLLLRLHILPSVQVRKKEHLNREQNRIEGRLVRFNHDKYHVNVGGPYLEAMSEILNVSHPKLKERKTTTHHGWLTGQYAILPIREINSIDYSGPVLNVAVPHTQTYVAKNFLVHNCDSPLFKDKMVATIGGSDSAAKEALLLTEYAKKVFIIYRGDKIHPEPINMDRVNEKIKSGKIEIIPNTNVVEVKGAKFLEKIILDKPYKGKKEFPIEGVFVDIGHLPQSGLAAKLGVKLNEKNEIIIDKDSKTNVDGVYAAGDVTNRTFKQLITGVAEGVIAAAEAYEFIEKQKSKK